MSFFWGGGLMHGIKIPQQDFVLKTQRGGLMREGGGIFAGHYNISSLLVSTVAVKIRFPFRFRTTIVVR